MSAPFDIDAAYAMFRTSLDAATDIVVSTHLRPDGDAIGSETGLVHYLVSLGKRVRVINNDPTPELLRFVVPREVEIEVYDPAVHDALYESTDLVCLVDNSAPDRLGRLEPIIRSVADKVLCIDHHPERQAPWKRLILDTSASATTVMILRLLREAGFEPDAHAAQALYTGLATDTGFFRFNSTNIESHHVAAELLPLGARPAEVFRAIHERNSVAFTRLLGAALSDLRMDEQGQIATVRIPRRIVEQLGAEQEDTSEIMTALLALDGVPRRRALPGAGRWRDQGVAALQA